jgi:hypothetical protein
MMACAKGRLSLALLVCAALGVAVGCSGSGDDLPREAVSGTVTLDGQLLPNGSISFMPSGGSGAGPTPTGGGGAIASGKFSIARDTGLVPGSYNVAIYASEQSAERTKPAQAGAGIKPAERAKELIPAKYNTSTELKAEIKKGGGNDLTFTLESK